MVNGEAVLHRYHYKKRAAPCTALLYENDFYFSPSLSRIMPACPVLRECNSRLDQFDWSITDMLSVLEEEWLK